MKPFDDFCNNNLNTFTSSQSPLDKIEVYLIIDIEEREQLDVLKLKNYGVVGLVQKGTTLDQAILTEFRVFLANGYSVFNHWWKAGTYDRMASYGILIKVGKTSLNPRHVRGHSCCPIRVLQTDESTAILACISEIMKLQQARIQLASLFGERLVEKLEIQLLPQLSDPQKGILRIVPNPRLSPTQAKFDYHAYPLFLLSTIFCAYSYPELTHFQVTARFTYLETNQLITEHSALYQFKVKELELRKFMYRHTILSANDIQKRTVVNGKKTIDSVVSFIKERLTIMEQHSHPVDK